MMKQEDFERFEANREWFNQFFSDLQQLFGRIAQMQTDAFGVRSAGYYYPKQNFVPGIPSYYLMAQGGESYSIQVFAVFDPKELNKQLEFQTEASLVIVRHSQGTQPLWPDDFGLPVIRNDNVTVERLANGAITGRIFGKTQYQAFQVAFSKFAVGTDINQAIETEIIQVLKSLPPFIGPDT